MIATNKKEKSLLKGSIFMIAAFFFVSLFGMFLKLAAEVSTPLWGLFLAYLFGLSLQLIFTFKNGISFIKTKRPLGHFIRGFVGFFATLFYFLSIKFIPLMNATLLFNTTPLFVPIISWVFLKTKVPLKIWISVLIGFIGAVLILRPQSGFFEFGALLGLISGICLAIAFVTVQVLSTTEPKDRINLYFFIIGMIGSLFLFPYFGQIQSNWVFLYGALVGISFFLFQQFLVLAYTYADAHEVGVFQYISVAFAGFWGWLVWNHTPNSMEYIGIILVILGGSMVILQRKKTNAT